MNRGMISFAALRIVRLLFEITKPSDLPRLHEYESENGPQEFLVRIVLQEAPLTTDPREHRSLALCLVEC